MLFRIFVIEIAYLLDSLVMLNTWLKDIIIGANNDYILIHKFYDPIKVWKINNLNFFPICLLLSIHSERKNQDLNTNNLGL